MVWGVQMWVADWGFTFFFYRNMRDQLKKKETKKIQSTHLWKHKKFSLFCFLISTDSEAIASLKGFRCNMIVSLFILILICLKELTTVSTFEIWMHLD